MNLTPQGQHHRPDEHASLAQALDYYRQTISILKRGYEQERHRITVIQRHPLAQKLPREITSVDLAEYRDSRLSSIVPRTKKPVSGSSVRLELSLLSNFFDLARIEWGICGDNPVKNIRKPKPAPGRDRRITSREERQILRYAYAYENPELYNIIVVALGTAMRQSEILGLRWENIDLKNQIAHLPETKNGTKRDVPLSLKVRDQLISMNPKTVGKVFTYTPAGLKSVWRTMRLALSIEDLHFHDMRHEAISRLFELGTLDMMEISAISGHKSLAMLKRYTHLRARNLVAKLEGSRNKGRIWVLNQMVPYPASVKHNGASVTCRVLDFDDLSAEAADTPTALRLAQAALVQRLMQHIEAAIPIPAPDQYAEPIDQSLIVMVDPLNRQTQNTKFSEKYSRIPT